MERIKKVAADLKELKRRVDEGIYFELKAEFPDAPRREDVGIRNRAEPKYRPALRTEIQEFRRAVRASSERRKIDHSLNPDGSERIMEL